MLMKALGFFNERNGGKKYMEKERTKMTYKEFKELLEEKLQEIIERELVGIRFEMQTEDDGKPCKDSICFKIMQDGGAGRLKLSFNLYSFYERAEETEACTEAVNRAVGVICGKLLELTDYQESLFKT